MRACIYLRVSKTDQNPENQLPALRKIAESRGLDVVRVIQERVSGAKKKRDGLTQLLEGAHQGEFQVVLVWAIDRLGRSMKGVVDSIQTLDSKGCRIISHQEAWLDTQGPVRELLVSIFAWVAQMERQKLIERTQAGLHTARSKGIKLGRPRVTVDVDRALRLMKDGATLRETAKRLGCGAATLHRAVKAKGT